MNYEHHYNVNGIPVRKATPADVTGLPAASEYSDAMYFFYIVSTIVKNAQPGRTDLLVPDTGSAKRDEKGNILSVPGFII